MIAGNWKMYKTVPEAVELASGVASGLTGGESCDILLCPNNLALQKVSEACSATAVMVGGQNLHWEDQGAFTAEVSGSMLKSAGASHVIIGHSERRQYFGETEKTVNLRVGAALKHSLVPVLCIGETIDERRGGKTQGVLASQLAGGLAGFGAADLAGLILAYEPVWAIGTGETATDEQAQETHAFIRTWMTQNFDNQLANSCRILYGGSVKPANAAGLLRQPDVDGALVGGASLEAESFLGIIAAA